jgi:hypothetical protein
MRAIRDANPHLTIHQCRDYLKRARTLGLVRTPPATGAPLAALAARTVPEGGVSEAAVDRVLADGRLPAIVAAGVRVDGSLLDVLGLVDGCDPGQLAAAVRARLAAH